MLGPGHSHARQCHEEGWFGGGWGIAEDLSTAISGGRENFKDTVMPLYGNSNPGKSRVAAGLACGMLRTICMGIQQDDVVLCPDGEGAYWTGAVAGPYYYAEGEFLPHRRKVNWRPGQIYRADMSESLQGATGSNGTVSNVSAHAEEIEKLFAGGAQPQLTAADERIEDPSVFALEKHLEDFLVENWPSTELGRRYDIFEDDGERAGQQYPTDTGPVDILAVSKDGGEILVVELKKGRASDVVVGQTQRYMGYVMDELAEPGQTVKGCIIALKDDLRLRRALRAADNIDFYRYEVNFKLFKSEQ